MRQLEEKIAAWRAGLAGKAAPEVIEELESHLRDSIDGYVARGKLPDEAFALAAQRFGDNEALARELAKTEQRGWLPVKLAFGIAVMTAIAMTVLTPKLFSREHGVLLAAHVWTITLGYLSVFLIGALGICYALQRLMREPGPSIERTAVRGARKLAIVALTSCAIGTALGAAWAKLAWGFAWSWDLKEMGGLSVTIWLALFLVAQARMSARATMLLAIFGNCVVSSAWFGAARSLAPMTILIALNAAAFAIALVPAELFSKDAADRRASAR